MANKPLHHRQVAPKIHPNKPLYRAFRRVSETLYPSAKAVLTEHFKLDAAQADSLLSGANDNAVIFRQPWLMEAFFAALRLKSGAWFPAVSLASAEFKSPGEAKRQARETCRARGEAYNPAEWVYMVKSQPASLAIH